MYELAVNTPVYYIYIYTAPEEGGQVVSLAQDSGFPIYEEDGPSFGCRKWDDPTDIDAHGYRVRMRLVG